MASAACASPVEGDGCENTTEAEPALPDSTTGPAEEEQNAGEVPPTSDEHSADGKSKPASEKIWGSFLKNSGLGKVMGGRKKKEQAAGDADASAEGGEQEKSPGQNNQGEGPSTPNDQGSQQAGSQEQSVEKEVDGEENTQEQKASSLSKDAKPKQGEKSSVRDFIRKPVAKIFSHRNTEKKDCGSEAPKHGKTRSRSLDRLEDPEAGASAADQTDDSQGGGEPHKSTHHSAKHMKRWHSFKKLMAQKSQKRSTEEHKDTESAEAPGSEAHLDPDAAEPAGKLDHTGQKRWKLKRSWTFQGLKRDPSVVGIHKQKGSDKDSLDNPKGEEGPANDDLGAAASSEETKSGKGDTLERSSAEPEEEKAQRTKSVDHHANEIWTSFKKRVIPKSKRTSDAGAGGGGGGGGEEEAAEEHEQTEDQTDQEHGKAAKSKRTHFNRAVSLKNFIMRKSKSSSVDLGDGPAEQKEEGAESAGDTSSAPVTKEVKEGDRPAKQAAVSKPAAPATVQNGGDEKAESVDTKTRPSAATGQVAEKGQPDAKKETPAEKKETQAEKKETPAEKKETQAEKKETQAEKKETPAEKKETQAEKKETPAEKKETPVEKKETPAKKKETPAEPALEAACGETKGHKENGSSGAGCDIKGSAMEDENPKDFMAHDPEIIPQEDRPQEIANKQEDINSQDVAAHQTENACSTGSKDELSLNQEQGSDGKSCSGNAVAKSGECSAENGRCNPLQTGGGVAVLDASFELAPILNGPPLNGGAHPGTVETETEPSDQEENQKRMICEAAASIVQTAVSAAAEQLAKEKDLLDNGVKGPYHNNDNLLDLNVNYYH